MGSLAEHSTKVESIAAASRVALVGSDAIVLDDWAAELRPRYDVKIFEATDRTLRRLSNEPFEVIVLDIGARDAEGGLAFLKQLCRAQPSAESIVVSELATAEAAVAAMRLGASDFICRPLPSVDDLTRRVDDAVTRLAGIGPPSRVSATDQGLLHGESAQMQHVRKLIARFAGSRLPVMILGQSGTGKELAARSVHAASPRADRPFVAINCAGLSETLIDSELFGHERGAFTGAQASHKGLFDSADGGTLFLDEIGDVPAQTQVRLLRALQEGEVRPVGASKLHHVDVRVISATNIDMKKAIAAGQFRQDLYFRLSPMK